MLPHRHHIAHKYLRMHYKQKIDTPDLLYHHINGYSSLYPCTLWLESCVAECHLGIGLELNLHNCKWREARKTWFLLIIKTLCYSEIEFIYFFQLPFVLPNVNTRIPSCIVVNCIVVAGSSSVVVEEAIGIVVDIVVGFSGIVVVIVVVKAAVVEASAVVVVAIVVLVINVVESVVTVVGTLVASVVNSIR